ncbi:MAG TPA: hypothetical protein VGQ53_08195 [Chitinophagaceae bacterium]|jgi:hypothetical protein|nr:hypothetical protein [Chitinophagaceae bacterium]
MKTNDSLLRIFFLSAILFIAYAINAQTYPEPEFSNEPYYLNKSAGNTLVRLEKNSSKMDTKANAISGSESGYSIDGSKSSVRLSTGNNVSFVFSSGSSGSSSTTSSAKSDSIMRANGVDPAMMSGMDDLSKKLTLYKVESGKGVRKVLLQKAPGMNPFGSHKLQSSEKYTFSVRKVKEGYWELVVDKPLPKGEYAFTMMSMGMSGMDGSTVIFAFGVD